MYQNSDTRLHTHTYEQKINFLDIQLKQREKKYAMIRRKRFTFCNKVDKKTQSRMKMQIQQSFFYNEFYKKGKHEKHEKHTKTGVYLGSHPL